KTSGVRVFGSANGDWVRTRRIWNSHTYHVTNVDETGGIPAHETPNWTVQGLNDYRQNKQPGSEFAAPNAIVTLAADWAINCGLRATVRTLGESALPAGISVTFYEDTTPMPTALGTGKTTLVLSPAEAEKVILPLPNAPPDVVSGKTLVFAEVN